MDTEPHLSIKSSVSNSCCVCISTQELWVNIQIDNKTSQDCSVWETIKEREQEN